MSSRSPSPFPGRRPLRRELPPVQHAGGPAVHGRRRGNGGRPPRGGPGQLRLAAGAAGAPVQPAGVGPRRRGHAPGHRRLRAAQDVQRELLCHLQPDRQVQEGLRRLNGAIGVLNLNICHSLFVFNLASKTENLLH